MTEDYLSRVTQYDDELNPFIAALIEGNTKSFIEIGSRFGGSLWRIANALPKGSKIVSVDSGKGMGGNKPGAQESLIACVNKLKELGYNAHLIIGDSHSREIIDRAMSFAPFDAAFIDGDHTLEGVTLDWIYYGRHTRICGFHDVAWEKPTPYAGKLVDCKAFWDVLSKRYRSETHVHPNGNMGVGFLWPPQRN